MLLSVVIPVYNEAEVLPELLSAMGRVLQGMNCAYELVFVNDGSDDPTREILMEEAQRDPCIKVLEFSRNFGHQAAITAGLDFASGDAVVVMDADLQDPPELLPKMVELFEEGYDVVSAQRVARSGESVFKLKTAALFYQFMRTMIHKRLVPEVGDFRLFSREAVLALRHFREQYRFMRGLVAWLGLKEAVLPFERPPRRAGKTKYGLLKMVRFAVTAITSFSGLPLRLALGLGTVITLFGFGYFFYSLFEAVIMKATVPGWTSLVCIHIIFSGTILMAVGLIGDYVARIYDEIKARPLYVLSSTQNVVGGKFSPARVVILPARASGEVTTGLQRHHSAHAGSAR